MTRSGQDSARREAGPAPDEARVDAVVVAFRSNATLRACVEPLAALPGVRPIVVDNASPDDPAEVLVGVKVELVRAGRNAGFAAGCNLGLAAGSAPLALLLNPDARIYPASLRALEGVLAAEERVALAAPRILGEDGRLAFSQRRFARLRSTWAQSLFLHRVWPTAGWTDEVVRDAGAYERPASPEWVSGACVLSRRAALEAVGGLDERFFLYCEDMDLCRRLRAAGHEIRYEPAATVRHVGGASSEAGATLPLYARSRVAYARRHYARRAVALESAGVAVGAATHVLSSARRPAIRHGHAAALRAVLRGAG